MNYIAKILLNSLYGRFGMEETFTYSEIIDYNNYPNFEKKNIDNIINVVDLDKNYLVNLRNIKAEQSNTDLDNNIEIPNINVAIAAAVTAYARIHMSQFKNNNLLPNLYYSDTDSVYFDGPIDNSLISNTELGKMKLEGIYNEAIFLAPKVYALKNDQSSIVKIKGLNFDNIKNSNITLESLYLLLTKDNNFKIPKNKWYRHINEGTITILDQLYTLKVTDSKRLLIYNNSNILYNTAPYILDNKIILNQNN